MTRNVLKECAVRQNLILRIDTRAIQHGLERVAEEKNNENGIARVEGEQCVLTGTNSVLLWGGGTQTAMYHTYASAMLATGAKTDHGRPDQNTNARKLSETKGAGGTVQRDMKTGELAKHGPSWKIERRSTVRVARQVWVQRVQHTRKEWRGRNPHLKTGKSKVGVMFVFMQAERRRNTPIRTRVSTIRPYAAKEAEGVQWYVYDVEEK